MKLPAQTKPVLRIPAPVHKSFGLGDVVKTVTQRLGFETCGGCERRAAALNRWVSFTPYGRFRH
jgi:hypothetical protein